MSLKNRMSDMPWQASRAPSFLIEPAALTGEGWVQSRALDCGLRGLVKGQTNQHKSALGYVDGALRRLTLADTRYPTLVHASKLKQAILRLKSR